MGEDYADFVNEQYVPVVRFLMRMGASLADAEDSAQHMALQAWRKVRGRQWDQIANPKAWARTVALNHYRGRCRDRREYPTDMIADGPAPGPGHDELVGQAHDLVAVLRLLDPRCRAVIAFDLDDVAGADIAAALDVSPQQVRDLRAKARREMKKHLAEREGIRRD